MSKTALVLGKELTEFRRDRLLVGSWVAGAVIVGGFAAGLSWYAGSSPGAAREILAGDQTFRTQIPPGLDVTRQALDLVLNRVVPMVCAFIALAAGLFGGLGSLISERDGRTLETLLSQPIGGRDLLLGKLLANVIVCTAGIVGAQLLVLLLGIPWLYAHHAGWPGLRFGAIMLVEVPLLAGLGTTVALVIALRVESSRAAQAVAGLGSIALVSLAAPLVMLSLSRGDRLALVCAGWLLVDLALFGLALARFDREKVLRGQF